MSVNLLTFIFIAKSDGLYIGPRAAEMSLRHLPSEIQGGICWLRADGLDDKAEKHHHAAVCLSGAVYNSVSDFRLRSMLHALVNLEEIQVIATEYIIRSTCCIHVFSSKKIFLGYFGKDTRCPS